MEFGGKLYIFCKHWEMKVQVNCIYIKVTVCCYIYDVHHGMNSYIQYILPHFIYPVTLYLWPGIFCDYLGHLTSHNM